MIWYCPLWAKPAWFLVLGLPLKGLISFRDSIFHINTSYNPYLGNVGHHIAPVWVFWLWAFCSPPPEAGPLHAPTASFFHRHLPQWCSGQIALEPSPVDRSVFCFMFFFGFPVFCFLCIIFVLIFLCILFLLGFPIFTLVFPCIAHLCLFCVFFGFYSSADLLRACFVALRPLPGFFSRPHSVELSMRPSVYKVCLHPIGFISLYFILFFLLVISPILIVLLLGVMLGLDL